MLFPLTFFVAGPRIITNIPAARRLNKQNKALHWLRQLWHHYVEMNLILRKKRKPFTTGVWNHGYDAVFLREQHFLQEISSVKSYIRQRCTIKHLTTANIPANNMEWQHDYLPMSWNQLSNWPFHFSVPKNGIWQNTMSWLWATSKWNFRLQ